MSCIFTNLIVHNCPSNQSAALMTRCRTDSRHQYGIFCSESRMSVSQNATRAGREGWLFSQAITYQAVQGQNPLVRLQNLPTNLQEMTYMWYIELNVVEASAKQNRIYIILVAWDTPRKIGQGCMARFPKALPHLRLKPMISLSYLLPDQKFYLNFFCWI